MSGLAAMSVEPGTGTVRVCEGHEAVRVAVCGCAVDNRLRRVLGQKNGELGVWRIPKAMGGGHAAVIFQRRLWDGGPCPPPLLARFCPFCGDPYAAPGEVVMSPAERAVLLLVSDPQGAARALAALRERGLIDAEGAAVLQQGRGR